MHVVGERGAVDVFHDQELQAVMDAAVVEGDYVGVFDLCGGHGLALEAMEQVLRGVVVAYKQFDGHAAVEIAVAAGPDLAHPAPAKPLAQLVLARDQCAALHLHSNRLCCDP